MFNFYLKYREGGGVNSGSKQCMGNCYKTSYTVSVKTPTYFTGKKLYYRSRNYFWSTSSVENELAKKN